MGKNTLNTPLFHLYGQDNIDTLPWPKTEQGALAEHYLKPLIQEGPEHYFSNVSTTLQALLIDDCVFPITINERVQKNAYVCSTFTHYVNYALEEVEGLKNRLSKSVLKKLIHCLGRLLKWGEIDKAVFVNNWLLPTNLYPSLSPKQIENISKGLLNHFPQHAIAFRSVNALSRPTFLSSFQQLGYDLILCRDIYYTDTRSDMFPTKARMVKSDLKLLEGSHGGSVYKILKDWEINEASSERIAELYRMLNIDKHSSCNPCYTARWIELIQKIPGFTLNAFEKEGSIEAVIAYYTLNGVMTSPLFGYDTLLPQELGLYRRISALLLKDAHAQQKLLHQSSGAGHFKMLRRARQEFEYTAVYSNHLSWRRKMPWKLLYHAMNVIGKAYLTVK